MATSQEAMEKIWNDPEFKKRLLADPKAGLAELGMHVGASQDVRIWENTPREMNFVLPDEAEMPAGYDPEAAYGVVGKVVKKAWSDASFKARLLANANDAVADAVGLEVPAAVKVRVHEDTPRVKNVILPVDPADDELSDVELEAMAGGALSKGPSTTTCGIGGLFGGHLPQTLMPIPGAIAPGTTPHAAPASALGPAVGNSSFGPC
jgi:hypothetical protein